MKKKKTAKAEKPAKTKKRKVAKAETLQAGEVTTELVDEEIRQEKFRRLKRQFSNIFHPTPKQETKAERYFSTKVWPWLLPFIIVMVLLVILPLVTMLVYSFVVPTGDPVKQWRITFENFAQMFTNVGVMLALLNSIWFAFLAAVIAVFLGYPVAYIMSNLQSKILAKNAWVLVTMPMWISMLLKVLGLQTLFYLMSPSIIGTRVSVVVGMVYMFLPFAITPVYESVSSRDISLEEASKDLGASATKTFWKVTIRQTIPGILTGFSIVLINASTSLIAVHYLGAGKIRLITSIIESYFFRGTNFAYGSAIAVVLTILVFLLMVIIRAITNSFDKKGKRNKWKNSSKIPTLQ